jgi:anti-sigma factor RsiW
MNCQHAQNLISSFIDRELSADETRELRKHLFSCPECDREHQEILRLKNCLENIIQEPYHFDSVQCLRSRLLEEEYSFLQPANKRVWIRRVSIVAACFAIYLVTSALLFPAHRNTSELVLRRSELNSTPVSWDQNFSLDQSVSVYQASLILP